MKKKLLLAALVCVAGLLCSNVGMTALATEPGDLCSPALTNKKPGKIKYQQESREQITIRWLVKTLNRMGETKTAKRLMDDYYEKKRVKFQFINSADGNAYTDPGIIRNNTIILSESMLNIAEADRLLKKNPYSGTSPLISYALTVVHEYVHVDQTLPLNYPKWENPAWQFSDKTLANWVKKIETEYNNTRKLPPSESRTAKLNELKDIINRLHVELVNIRNSVNGNVANGSLSPNQKWMLDETEKKIAALKKAIFDYEALAKVGAPAIAKKDPGYWELVTTQAYDKLAAGDNNYSLTAGDGSLSAKWRMGNDVFDVKASYSSPPKQIKPADKIPVTMSVAVQNQGDAYSANGDFAIYFDKPEVEPGVIIAPISLKGDKGEGAGIRFTHKQGIPPSPSSSLQVFIDGKSLPAGKKGDRIALLAALYIGRSAGYKYIYEWKDNW